MATGIEWTDDTWNPVTGCSKVSPGCAHCYAEGVADRFWATQYPQNIPFLRDKSDPNSLATRARQFTDVMCHEDRLYQPLKWRKPRRIFVNSMSDLFHEDVPDEFIDKVFAVMALAPQHTFQVLTKRAERMRDYMTTEGRRYRVDEASAPAPCGDWPWPLPNVWLGVSVENQRFADERIPLLLQTPAAIRFISAEPLLGPVTLAQFHAGTVTRDWLRGETRLSWVIVGGESGPRSRPFHLAWARSIVQQCQSSGVPVFVKQLGRNIRDRNDAGWDAGSHVFADGADQGQPVDPGAWPDHIANEDRVEHNPDGWREEYQGAPVRVHLRNKKGGDPSEWPTDLRVREFPKVAIHAD